MSKQADKPDFAMQDLLALFAELPEGQGFSSEELTVCKKCSRERIRRILRALWKADRLDVFWRTEYDISGKRCRVPIYALKKA